jgi:hypothetical protein
MSSALGEQRVSQFLWLIAFEPTRHAALARKQHWPWTTGSHDDI